MQLNDVYTFVYKGDFTINIQNIKINSFFLHYLNYNVKILTCLFNK